MPKPRGALGIMVVGGGAGAGRTSPLPASQELLLGGWLHHAAHLFAGALHHQLPVVRVVVLLRLAGAGMGTRGAGAVVGPGLAYAITLLHFHVGCLDVGGGGGDPGQSGGDDELTFVHAFSPVSSRLVVARYEPRVGPGMSSQLGSGGVSWSLRRGPGGVLTRNNQNSQLRSVGGMRLFTSRVSQSLKSTQNSRLRQESPS